MRKVNKKAISGNEALLFVIFAILMALIIINLFLYTICDWKHYKGQVPEYQVKEYVEPQERGNFYDRNGKPLTQNVDVCRVNIDTSRDVFVKYDSQLKNQCPITLKLAVELLAKTLNQDQGKVNVDPNELYNRIMEERAKPKGKKTICVAQYLDIKYYDMINKLNYRGITAEKTVMRYYPEGTLASRVIGACKRDGEPLEGLELKYAKYTEGQPGKFRAQRDKLGRVLENTKVYKIENGKRLEKIDGADIYLTIDANIQNYAERALNEMAGAFNPSVAMCVVMDPKTSEILAMANYPKYDPNNHNKYEPGMSKNYAVQNLYEPGSTSKVFTIAMGIDQGLGADQSFGGCSNVISFGKTQVKCDHGPHGACTPRNIIAKSCNIGAWYVGKRCGKNKLYQYLKAFGVVDCTPGDEFGYEAKSRDWTPVKKWSNIDTCNRSFGQGYQTSALALCNAYCAIANGGVYHTPKIIREIKTRDNKVLREEKVDEGQRIISQHTASVMAELLAGCVNNGTGRPAKLPDCQATGKTGSAQKWIVGEGWSKREYLVSFIGFAPEKNPELVCAVMVDYPKGSTYGAVVAAPVWKKVMEQSLKYRMNSVKN